MISVTASDVITAASLLLSIVSLIVVITLSVVLRRFLKHMSAEQAIVDTPAVVAEFTGRMRALEQKVIDQKVRLEILDLRVGKEGKLGSNFDRQPTEGGGLSKPIDRPRGSVTTIPPESLVTGPDVGRTVPANTVKLVSSARQIQDDILQIVLAEGGNVSARDIQLRIGRSREHTARTMNALFQEGLVMRTESTPFKYSLTETGRLLALKQSARNE